MSEFAEDTVAVQRWALAIATAFLVAGVAGFIPGLTTEFDEMELAGHDSGAMLLGIFQVSVLHNLVHLVFAVSGYVLARRAASARLWLVAGGAAYLLVFLWGVLVGAHDEANLLPLNDADDVLHVVLGLGMLLPGLLIGRRGPVPMT